MRWSWTPSETGRRRCSSSFPIPMTPSISSWQSCIPSSSTFCATRQMTFTTDGFPSMCAVCWTSLRTSVKSRSLISSSPPSEAGKSRRQSSCSPSLSSRPSTRTRLTPSRATVTARFSSAARRNPRSRKSARCWARRQSTFTTPQKPVPATTPTA